MKQKLKRRNIQMNIFDYPKKIEKLKEGNKKVFKITKGRKNLKNQ